MALSGRQISISLVKETTQGTTPSAKLKPLKYKTASLKPIVNNVISETVNNRRGVTDRRPVTLGANGAIETDFHYNNLNEILESAFFNEFAAFSKTATVSAVASGNKITRTTGSFITDGFVKGMVVKVAGFTTTGNNGIAVIVSVVALEMVIANITLANEASVSITFTCSQLKNSNTQVTLSIEENIEDNSCFRAFKGMMVNTAAINVPARNIVNCSFDFLGYSFDNPASTIGTGYDAQTTDKFIDSSNNFPKIYVDGVAKAFTELNYSINNNLREQAGVGSSSLIGIGDGLQDVTVNVGVYFEDETDFNKFKNNTNFALVALFQDEDNNTIAISMPNCKYVDATANASGNNADFVENFVIGAIEDKTDLYQIAIFKIPTA